MADREKISRGLENDESLRHIARRLARSASTISREVRLFGGREKYRAWIAEKWAAKRARRPKPLKLVTQPALRRVVEQGLEKQ